MDMNAAQPGRQLNRRKFLGGALAAGVLSPIIAACSSGSPATTSAAAGKKSTTVRLGYSSNGVTATAKNRGVFVKSLAAQGIDVTWVGPFPNHAPDKSIRRCLINLRQAHLAARQQQTYQSNGNPQ